MPFYGSKYFLVLLFFVAAAFSVELRAQEDCDEDISAKAKALCEKGQDRKKYNKEKRVEYLREAIELESDYAEANFLLGMEVIKTAMANGSGFMNAAKYFEKTAAICPEYHSDMYYYLGAIYLGQRDFKKAVVYQEKFLNFKSEDVNKYSKKFEEYLIETGRDYEYAKFFAEAYENPVPFDPQVVRDVSTNDADEYLPLLSPDNEFLYFTRRWEDKTPDRSTTIQTDKIRYIEKFSKAPYENGKFSVGDAMPEPFNIDKDINYGGVSVSLNNRHMYLTICKDRFNKTTQQMVKNCDIYQSNYVHTLNTKTGNTEWHWTEPVNMGPNVNTPDGWESQPSISADGKHLYFASWREDSKGIDIYMSEMGADGKWKMAKNVGPPVNTEQHDKSPYIHSDSKTLYYASQGHIGFGGYDIFYVRQNDDHTWQKPKNIGHPINTQEDEHGFVVSTDGRKVYFSSEHLGNRRTRLNVLSFELYKEARPEKVVLLKGNVEQHNGHTPTRVEIKNMTNKAINEFEVDSSDGAFAAIVTVKPGDKVVMKIKGDDVAYNSRLVEVPEEEDETVPAGQPISQKMDVVVEKEEVGGSYQLADIQYETNSAEISERSKVILEDFAEYLIENTSIQVAIHGHTDNVGVKSENLALSADRAYSVKAYIEKLGVSPSRLSFQGFGDTKPLASNATEEGRSRNRRTEFVILKR
ncbi:MAG: PD40 domain-containing protein [Flavobacteriales bacterium]|nr:PD40 domain-containing protein [Flavobacteriales bacterium]